jgi:tryptophanyl-tRNA synthetase
MRVLSGIQPSGKLHLGNYLGYVRPNIDWHKNAEIGFIMIADLHALTTVQDPELMRTNNDEMLLDLLACGFDLQKTIIFRQSWVPEHTELMWVLATVTPMGLLERAVSYKEKVERGIVSSTGLFNYPVLQAADIALYDVNKVPVGRDQKQHLEITRDIVIKFNNIYGDVLIVPEGEIREEVAVVPGTDGQKMSKSYGNTIPLFGDEKLIERAIMGITTDSKGAKDPKDPEDCIMFHLHKLFLSANETKALAAEYKAGISYGDAKKKLFATYMDVFAPLRKKREEFAKKPDTIRDIMQEGAKKASGIAKGTMQRVRSAVGLS